MTSTIFITSLPLTVWHQRRIWFLSAFECMYATAALYGKTEIYSHFSALTLANQNLWKVEKYGGTKSKCRISLSGSLLFL